MITNEEALQEARRILDEFGNDKVAMVAILATLIIRTTTNNQGENQ